MKPSRGWLAAPVLLALLGVAGPATAHSELRSSTPAAGANLATPPQQVVLIFRDEVDPRFTNVTLTAGDGQPHPLSPKVAGTQVTVDVDDPTSEVTGRWRVGYRVVSADGHPITGVLTFTVKPSVQPTREPSPPTSSASPSQLATTAGLPASTTAPGTAPSARDTGTSTAGQGFSPMPWLLAGLVVLMMASGAAVWRARNRGLR